MSKIILTYGEPVSPSKLVLSILKNKKFVNDNHKANYLRILVKSKNNVMATLGYACTPSAMQHAIDIQHLYNIIDELAVKVKVKSDIEDIFG